jgi:hypothetical protein
VFRANWTYGKDYGHGGGLFSGSETDLSDWEPSWAFSKEYGAAKA